MTLTVHPDPQEPAGGYAFLELAEGSLPQDSVTVAVFDAYGERWLAPSQDDGEKISIGNPNWQAERHDFGPYKVYGHEGADWVRIGPEIVNKIEEYSPLRLSINGVEHTATWPDDIPPRAGAAVLGGIQAVARVRPDPVVHPAVQPPVAELHAESGVPDLPEDPDTPTGGFRIWIWLIALILLVAIAVGVWWFWMRDDALTAKVPSDSTPVATRERCSFAALSVLPGGFAEAGAALRDCGREVSPDVALEVIESFAAQDDPDALLLIGTLYDGTELDARIEKLIGLTFDPDDARAAGYYARASSAGSDAAQTRLGDTCARLSGSASTLAKGAFDDFCK
ncbi:hypothetical protein ACXYMO_04815 [Arenibacterium sp. CAU 1754]